MRREISEWGTTTLGRFPRQRGRADPLTGLKSGMDSPAQVHRTGKCRQLEPASCHFRRPARLCMRPLRVFGELSRAGTGTATLSLDAVGGRCRERSFQRSLTPELRRTRLSARTQAGSSRGCGERGPRFPEALGHAANHQSDKEVASFGPTSSTGSRARPSRARATQISVPSD